VVDSVSPSAQENAGFGEEHVHPLTRCPNNDAGAIDRQNQQHPAVGIILCSLVIFVQPTSKDR
jgi:hypothetical protein